MHIMSSAQLAALVPTVREIVKSKGYDTSMIGLLGMDRNHFVIINRQRRTLGMGQVNKGGSISLVLPAQEMRTK